MFRETQQGGGLRRVNRSSPRSSAYRNGNCPSGYYSEFLGLSDQLSDEDMVTAEDKTRMQREIAFLKERLSITNAISRLQLQRGLGKITESDFVTFDKPHESASFEFLDSTRFEIQESYKKASMGLWEMSNKSRKLLLVRRMKPQCLSDF